MSDSIYGNTKQALVNKIRASGESEHQQKLTNPEYLKFCSALDSISMKYGSEPVRSGRKWFLWWISATFKKHWKHPTKDSLNRMAYGMFMVEMAFEEVATVIEAWMRWNNRHPNAEELRKTARQLRKTKEEVEPQVLKRRWQRTLKRRRVRKMKNATKGRPHSTVTAGILAALKEQSCTPAFLIDKTGAKDTAIRSALFRLKNLGQIVEAHGMYSLPAPEPVPAEVPIAVQETIPAPSVAVSDTEHWYVAADPLNPTAEQMRIVYERLYKAGNWSRDKFARFLKGGPDVGNGYPHLLSLIGIEIEAHTCCGASQ